MLDGEELGRLGAVLNQVGIPDGRRQAVPLAQDWRVIACLRLLVLTGARLGEVLGLQWGWINWERGYARLPDSKTGPKTIPLPPPALEVLETIKREHHTIGESKFVLPGRRADRHFRTIQKPWQCIRAAAELNDVRIHDLRHCYASTAVASGESLYVVGAILGHRSSATTQRYAHLALGPVWDAANRTAERLSKLLGPTAVFAVANEAATGHGPMATPPSTPKLPAQEPAL